MRPRGESRALLWRGLLFGVAVAGGLALSAALASSSFSAPLVSAADAPAIGFPLRFACGSSVCPGDRDPVFSPDGRSIAFRRGPDVVVSRPDTTGGRVVTRGHSPFYGPAWSPRGRTLLLVCDDPASQPGLQPRLCTVDADGPIRQRPTVISRGVGVERRPFLWSPDGRRVAFTREAPYYLGTGWCCQLWVAEADGANAVLIGGGPPSAGGEVGSPGYWLVGWSSSGRLAFQKDKALWVADADGTERRLVSENARGAGWAPDGRLAFHIGDDLWMEDGFGSGRRLVSEDAPGSVVGWSPDGKRLYLQRQAGQISELSMVEIDDVRARPVTIIRELVPFVRFVLSPRGDLVAYGAPGRTVVVPLAEGMPRRVLPGVSPQAGAGGLPAWSPDGRTLMFESDRDCPGLVGLYSVGADSRRARQHTRRCRIDGTARADALVGTAYTDGIYGHAGADRIRAGDSHDLVVGGKGNDIIDGGFGDDRLFGGPGQDLIDGGGGWDAVVSRDGSADRIRCGPGRDAVWADRLDIVAQDCEKVDKQ
jgi:Tol biopolymer transport system component